MVTNPNYFSTSNDSDPLNQIKDAVDFPHTGLIKALNGAMSDRAIISGCDITITNSSAQGSTGNNFVTVTAGIGIIEGKRCAITGNAQTIAVAPPINSFHLVVAPKPSAVGSTQILLRTSSSTNEIPDLTAGDTIIAVIKYLGGSTAPEIQYLTADKKTNSLSIAREDSSVYTEGLTIQSTTNGDIEIEGKEQDKDIIFKVNDGGTPTEVMRIDGSTSRIGIGETAPDSMLHLKSASATSPTIKIENTGTEASEAEIIFQRTGTAAQSQDIGHIKFKALDDGGATHTYASLFADAQDETAGTEDGRLIFAVAKGGTDNVEILRLSGSEGFVFNDASKDLNFRIESNGNANILFVDGGNDNVGIGTNSNDANAILTVEGAISLDEISAPSNTANRGQLYTNADNHLHFINGAGTDVKVTEEVFIVALSDETTDLTTGIGKASFHMPFAMTLTGVKANCTTAPAGATIIVDINEAGNTIFSTQSNRPTIAIGATSANAAGIDDTALANDALITFDIDQVGSSTAGKGLKVTLYGYRA